MAGHTRLQRPAVTAGAAAAVVAACLARAVRRAHALARRTGLPRVAATAGAAAAVVAARLARAVRRTHAVARRAALPHVAAAAGAAAAIAAARLARAVRRARALAIRTRLTGVATPARAATAVIAARLARTVRNALATAARRLARADGDPGADVVPLRAAAEGVLRADAVFAGRIRAARRVLLLAAVLRWGLTLAVRARLARAAVAAGAAATVVPAALRAALWLAGHTGAVGVAGVACDPDAYVVPRGRAAEVIGAADASLASQVRAAARAGLRLAAIDHRGDTLATRARLIGSTCAARAATAVVTTRLRSAIGRAHTTATGLAARLECDTGAYVVPLGTAAVVVGVAHARLAVRCRRASRRLLLGAAVRGVLDARASGASLAHIAGSAGAAAAVVSAGLPGAVRCALTAAVPPTRRGGLLRADVIPLRLM